MEPASPLAMRAAPRGPQRRWPRGLLVLLVVLLGLRLAIPRPRGQVSWVPLAEAARVASETGRPILYEFTAAWCGPCKRMEREAFANPELAAFINTRLVPVQLVDRQKEDGANSPEIQSLRDRFRVEAFPTLVVARADGSFERAVGYAAPHLVNGFLKRVLKPRPTPPAKRAGGH
jgi:thiol:disulfide interchange protein